MLVLGLVLAWGWLMLGGARITERDVQTAVLTTLQREAPQEFLVTGELTSSATATGRSQWRVRVLNIPIGQTRVQVRIPGRMTYGFELADLRPDDIRFDPAGIVEVQLPRLQVQSVEPILEDASVDIQTSGADRIGTEAVRSTVERSFREVRPALRRQAERHLEDAEQPRVNSARALQRMLSTPLEAAGVTDARFRFILAPGDTLELGEGSRRVLSTPPSETP
ncbi:MAG: DUF4230 domain-containing protein [Rubricoccaceae bacterium]